MHKSLSMLILVAVVAAAGCKRHEVQPQTQSTPAAKPVPMTATPASSAAPPVHAGETNVGSLMPAYKAQMFDGKTFDLADERGNVILLNLWATWCGPCRFEIPELQKMHDKYGAKGFKVIGVSLDDSSADVVKKFVDEHKMTYPVLLDPEGKLANIFQTTVIPTTVLIDRSGKIVWKEFGAIEAGDATLQKALDQALAEKKS